ncbi:hypothetical protein JZ751_028875 [Albula glossodonta]|uniref:Uncharacterized protein n=1 Tax=Albula glossodonta TaxID=121402 RepID=A0A8T2NLN9_9TELE|nr:hypothetical protein JZ751_028875 [Albula glossodonta]
MSRVLQASRRFQSKARREYRSEQPRKERVSRGPAVWHGLPPPAQSNGGAEGEGGGSGLEGGAPSFVSRWWTSRQLFKPERKLLRHGAPSELRSLPTLAVLISNLLHTEGEGGARKLLELSHLRTDWTTTLQFKVWGVDGKMRPGTATLQNQLEYHGNNGASHGSHRSLMSVCAGHSVTREGAGLYRVIQHRCRYPKSGTTPRHQYSPDRFMLLAVCDDSTLLRCSHFCSVVFRLLNAQALMDAGESLVYTGWSIALQPHRRLPVGKASSCCCRESRLMQHRVTEKSDCIAGHFLTPPGRRGLTNHLEKV